MFNSFANSDITSSILSQVLFFSTSPSYCTSKLISSPLYSLKSLPCVGFSSTSAHIFFVCQCLTSTPHWLIWVFMNIYIAFMCSALFEIKALPFFSISMVLFLSWCNFFFSTVYTLASTKYFLRKTTLSLCCDPTNYRSVDLWAFRICFRDKLRTSAVPSLIMHPLWPLQ